MHFKVTGDQVQLEPVEKSVVMSLTKYCGVSAMISKVVPITYKIFINGELQATGKAHFDI
jgi:putative redox protein